MSCKLGPSGSEITLTNPDVYNKTEIPVGASMRAFDGTYWTDYAGSTGGKWVYHCEWNELTEDETWGASGVMTAASRTAMLRWQAPEETSGFIDVYIGDHVRRADLLDTSPERWHVTIEFEQK